MLAGLLVSTSHKLECGGAMATAAHVGMDSNACLGSGNVPLLAGVHHLPETLNVEFVSIV